MSFVLAPPSTLEQALEDVETRFLYNLPESELQSPERLFYQIEQAYWYYEDFKADKFKHLPHFKSLKSFATNIFKHCELLQNSTNSFTQLFADYANYKSKIPVCGCILLNPEMTKFLLVSDYNSGSWMFPRGKINEGETEYECAIREVYEETGYNARDNCNVNDVVVSFQGEKKILLYIGTNVAETTYFETHCRKEVGAIQFHPINNIPSNTFHVHPFMPKLKRWIAQQKKARLKMLLKSPQVAAMTGGVAKNNPVLLTPGTNKKRRNKGGNAKQGEVPAPMPALPIPTKILQRVKGQQQQQPNNDLRNQRNMDTFQVSSTEGWSVADMFRANAQLTGRDYNSYDGNPHAFGATHPRFVRYEGPVGQNVSAEVVESDYLAYAQQSVRDKLSRTLNVDPSMISVGEVLAAAAASTSSPIHSRDAAGQRQVRKYWPKFTLDISSIMNAVDTELKAHPIR